MFVSNKSKLNTIFVLGFVVFFLPFLGLPQSVDNVLYFLSGALIVVFSYFLKQSSKQSSRGKARKEEAREEAREEVRNDMTNHEEPRDY